MSRPINILFLPFVLSPFTACMDKYISPYVSPPTGYLVVEGYISGNSTTQFTLSRSIPLPGDSTPPAEKSAQVQVEGSDNSIVPLTEQPGGVYSDSVTLNPQAQYRLRIHTANGEEYLSDYAPFKTTPPIDSVSWTNGPAGVVIYVNSHDPTNATRYYQWEWDQTYEYHSAEDVQFEYISKTDTVIPRPDSDQIFRCWRSASSTALLLGSSAKLAQDVISLYPIKSIPSGDVQTSVLYSILVRQYALTADGYNFLSLMQKNTESLGTIFDAQPSQLAGNIHCLTHPGEEVIGYVSAGTVQQQRLFLSRAQVPSYYAYLCPFQDILLPADADLRQNFEGLYDPVYAITYGITPIGFYSNYASCVDCRAQGGTTVKPSYWPD